jgi:hypothetical protein
MKEQGFKWQVFKSNIIARSKHFKSMFQEYWKVMSSDTNDTMFVAIANCDLLPQQIPVMLEPSQPHRSPLEKPRSFPSVIWIRNCIFQFFLRAKIAISN